MKIIKKLEEKSGLAVLASVISWGGSQQPPSVDHAAVAIELGRKEPVRQTLLAAQGFMT